MRRFATFVILFIILYSVYYDLSFGTLPDKFSYARENEAADAEQIMEELGDESYRAIIVEPGHTVLSIVEQLHKGPTSASIQEIIYDFKQLNKGIEPEDIRIGSEYLFPIYR